MVRKKIVAGNWKMHTDLREALALASEIIDEIREESPHVILFPPFVFARTIFRMLNEHATIKLGAQNVHQEDFGAYTGEVSAAMLKSIGVDYVLIGHSERRAFFHEDDPLLLQKIMKVLDEGMTPVYCCGEPLAQREAGTHEIYVSQQLRESILQLEPEQLEKIIIAYEPVWAIGTGKTATPDQAQSMHAFIRKTIAEAFTESQSEMIPILYGGSVKPGNAREIFQQPDVDGGLIGGASLSPEQFTAIVRSF